MHNPNENGPKEKSSLLLFIPITLIGVYFVYLTVSVSFKVGFERGELHRLLHPPKVEAKVEAKVFDHRKLMKPTEDLIALGQRLYVANCQSCHGSEGYGDGTAGRLLAVKPRNFHGPLTDWKNGASTLAFYSTLEKGLGSMPAFPALNPEQKYAVIHYIHAAFMGNLNVPADSDAAIAALPAPGAGGAAISIEPYSETRVPVDYAIMQMVREAQRGAQEL